MKSIVTLARCDNYEKKPLEDALYKILNFLEGWDRNLKKSSRVLIKPNLLSSRNPEEGVTTHPEVLRAVIRLFKGRVKEIRVGDSPGGYGKNCDEVYEKTFTKRICQEEGVELIKFDDPKKVNGIPITNKVLESDFFVSVPKFKTHTITTITCGIKNSFGLIPGLFKPQSHGTYPTVLGFSNFVVDVYNIRKPDLLIVDAVLAMEGDGPNNGPLKKLNLIAGSNDGVSLDSLMAKIIGLKGLDVATTAIAHKRKIGEGNLENIEIAGDDINSFTRDDFKLPFISSRVLSPILKPVFKYCKFKPVIDKKICAKCNLCKESCPIGAIDSEYKIDYKKCILCLCCHEFCPQKAVKIKRNLMAKIVWG